MAKRLTYAMVGGGPDGFIGDAHRRAIGLDGTAAIAAGVFSRNREKSLQMAESLGISPDRCYEDYQTMARAEGEREDGVDFVTVVTPNQSHYEICRAFLEAGIHVVCDKPVTTTYRQAKELEALAEDKGLLFMVTYTYMGYVTAKYARELVASGAIGEVRTVMAEYPQGWLAFEDDFGGKQGEWRCDPGQSGGVNCLGDLGTHVENAVAAMTGLKIKRLLAKMDVIVPGRVLDDNDSILVEYDNGSHRNILDVAGGGGPWQQPENRIYGVKAPSNGSRKRLIRLRLLTQTIPSGKYTADTAPSGKGQVNTQGFRPDIPKAGLRPWAISTAALHNA